MFVLHSRPRIWFDNRPAFIQNTSKFSISALKDIIRQSLQFAAGFVCYPIKNPEATDGYELNLILSRVRGSVTNNNGFWIG
jgi:hypothetical protein